MASHSLSIDINVMIAFYSHVICNIAPVINAMLVYGWGMIQTLVGEYLRE